MSGLYSKYFISSLPSPKHQDFLRPSHYLMKWSLGRLHTVTMPPFFPGVFLGLPDGSVMRCDGDRLGPDPLGFLLQ